jgi:DNA-binding NarL/FixJ family response regulator
MRLTKMRFMSTDTETNKQMIKLPKIDEVIAEAKAKGITAYQIAKETRLSTQTVYAYFKGDRVSVRTQESIINYINKQ